MAQDSNVLLHLANKPENVLLVRETLSGIGQAIGLGNTDLNDIHTAVTEACNNVVLHAYEGDRGPLEVEVCLAEGEVEVTVRDHGTGMRERASRDGVSVGIGLPVIHALTHDFELLGTPEGGTEARMEFLTPGTRTFEASGSNDFELMALSDGHASETVAVSVIPLGLARTVLARLLSAAAVHAHFSTDQISDLQMVSDALVAHVPGSIDGSHLNMAVSIAPHSLELKIGPLGLGSSKRLLDSSQLDGIGGVIEKLSDRHEVAELEGYEVLTLGLLSRR